jgi:hypothetical protein
MKVGTKVQVGAKNAATSCRWKASMEKSGGNRKPET